MPRSRTDGSCESSILTFEGVGHTSKCSWPTPSLWSGAIPDCTRGPYTVIGIEKASTVWKTSTSTLVLSSQSSIFTFLRSLHNDFYRGWTNNSAINSEWGFLCTIISTNIGCFQSFWYMPFSLMYGWYATVVLICIYLIVSENEYIFICLLDIHMFSLRECDHFSCHFLWDYCAPLLLIFVRALYFFA